MDNNRQKELLELLAQAQEEVKSGNEVSTEFSRILFPPKRKEYELTYYGKESEQAIVSQTFAVPLQENRRFGDVSEKDWVNKIIFGDNLQVLKTLIEMKRRGELKNADGTDGVRLVYIDPPFATKQDFSNKDAKAYSDKLAGAEFLEWLRKRLILLREVLADNGSIFVHLDWHKAHYVKVLLDEIFGEGNFVNEIVWKYAGARTSKKSFGKKHDVIFFYTKNAGKQILNFDEVRDPYSETTIARNKYKNQGSSDRVLNYKPNEKGKYPEDVWDISIINPMSKERTGYPTQKPEALLEKVIKAASNKGDLVLDCFGGSGTTSAVAEKLGRRWITVDAGKLAIYTMQKRILDIDNYSPFVVYDAGLYDNEKLNAFDSTQWKQFAMALYNVQPSYQLIKGLSFDGMKDGSLVKVYSPSELNEMDAKISEVTLEQIYSRLGSSSPSEIFIIAPKGKFTFAVDEFDNDGEWDTIFNILRVPYSMYQKYTENFKGTIQAGDTDAVNEVVDAYGFDFMRKPNVDFEITCGKLKINSFESCSRLKGVENVTGFEAFALVLIDLSYDNDAFKMDKVYYHKDFDENHSILFDETEIDGQAMFIFVDKFGNEFVTTRGEKS
ncbi:Modification methylase RsrI [Streptococcus oralis]|uniref:Modification methylase RsrI n=1 Tax=Streptococcus oralis TaxID=1303 RepID=A0A3R9J7H4_STROR|nr:site-specific DNA-methyltransferase [Streptococcus oralis]MBS9407100.1 site-specific DNA-methyltransferase [Streptococcus oralis]RSI71216.1 Modification methylase RsrI [Streptococcus oralis]RSI74719.1 Modification methylase RsrI [Streptococcus oralis]